MAPRALGEDADRFFRLAHLSQRFAPAHLRPRRIWSLEHALRERIESPFKVSEREVDATPAIVVGGRLRIVLWYTAPKFGRNWPGLEKFAHARTAIRQACFSRKRRIHET